MEESKKRKLDETGNGQLLLPNMDANSTADELRTLLDPLAKPQLVDLLARAYFSNPSSLFELSGLCHHFPFSFFLHRDYRVDYSIFFVRNSLECVGKLMLSDFGLAFIPIN